MKKISIDMLHVARCILAMKGISPISLSTDGDPVAVSKNSILYKFKYDKKSISNQLKTGRKGSHSSPALHVITDGGGAYSANFSPDTTDHPQLAGLLSDFYPSKLVTKKIIMAITVDVTDGSVGFDQIAAAVGDFGKVTVLYGNEVETADSTGLTERTIVYIPADDSEPWLKAREMGDMYGEPFTDKEMQNLFDHGVCVNFYTRYPNAERYGAAYAAVDPDFAMGTVGAYGLRVSSNDFNVDAVDTQDDSSGTVWLTIVTPKKGKKK